MAYTAPHTPFHVPPSNMHGQGNLPEYTAGVDEMPYYMAAIEAMDFQIGRLLQNIPADERENTIVIFIGDNGTPGQVAQSPYTSTTVKNTLYQGGINTPMFISGKGVSRQGTDHQLLTATDLFATLAEIAGIPLGQYNDSKSFRSLFSQSSVIRNYQYSELNDGTMELWTISNGTYKLIIESSGNEEMYDLANDPYEQDDLLDGALSSIEQNAKSELETELISIRQ
jgi:arylsulfatase A-like enzyme